MKKAVLITCFYNFTFNTRICYVQDVLNILGYEVKIITSDFDHRNKKQYNIDRENVIQVPVFRYKKNLSMRRMLSHISFTYRAYKKVKEINPDLVFVGSPPNSCVSKFNGIKSENQNIKLVLSVTDMWPETMPIPDTIKKLLMPALKIWTSLRNKNLQNYDAILFECDLFRNSMKSIIQDKYTKTIYLSKKDEFGHINPILKEYNSNGELRLAYIGAINSIIDIDKIVQISHELSKYRSVRFTIIGSGEKTKEMIEKLRIMNIQVDYFGPVFNEEEKCRILSKQHLGINIMKDNVFVGATMKSLEYLCYGLPLINSIKGDTEEIIHRYNCGFNVSNQNILSTCEQIVYLTNQKFIEMSIASRKVFEELFSEQSSHRLLEDFFTHIIK